MNKSVPRRILAIAGVGAFLLVAMFLAVYAGHLDAFTALRDFAFLIAGFYFGTKAVQT